MVKYINNITDSIIKLYIVLHIKLCTLWPSILKKHIDIIGAYAIDGPRVDITTELTLFVNWYWNTELCEDIGGIPFNKLKAILPGINTIEIIYRYAYKIDAPIINTIKVLVLDLKNSQVHMFPISNDTIIHRDILFNQLSFDPEFEY